MSTATPSLGGAPPKLKTLKIGYPVPSYDYDRIQSIPTIGSLTIGCDYLPPQANRRTKMIGVTSLSSTLSEQSQGFTPGNIVNVLATNTEASMSSASFAIPRRATIDADVSNTISF